MIKTRSGEQSSPSAVHGRLLYWLLRYPLQRAEDLVLALEVSANTIYRHLTRLAEEGLIECVTPSLGVKTTCRLYYLSNAGLLLAAEQEQVDAGSLARCWNAHEQGILQLLPRIPTLVRLQNLVNGLVVHAPAMLAYPGGHRAQLTWQWQRDYILAMSSEDQLLRLSVDAALVFNRRASTQHGIGHCCVFLQMDPGFVGSHDRQLIRQKLEAMARYWQSRERSAGVQGLPPLLVLVQTQRQREIWQQCASQVAAALRVEPLPGAIAVLAPQEAAPEVWTLPWQKLAAPVSCRLRDLFMILPAERLPPGLLNQEREGMATVAGLTKRRILQGDFGKRAKSLAPAALAASRRTQKHESVALLSLLLSQRHLELLNLLYAHPLLNTREIAILLNLQGDSAARYLYELGRYGCVEKSQPGRRWHLAEGGLRLIAASHHVSLSHLAEPTGAEQEGKLVQRGLPLLKRTLARTVGLYALFTALQQGLRDQGADHELLWWEMGRRCEQRYSDHGVELSLRPDAAFACKAGNTSLLAWVAYPSGIVSKGDLIATVQGYGHFVKAREWAAAGFPSIPILCLIVPEKKDVQRLAPIVREGLGESRLLVRMTSASQLEEYGPLAAIWVSIAVPATKSETSRAALRPLLDLGSSAAGRK